MALRQHALFLVVLMTAALLAGCSGTAPQDGARIQESLDPAPATTEVQSPESAEEKVLPASMTAQDKKKSKTAVERQSVQVYASRGLFVGTDPAHPAKQGPLVEDSPVAREDMFLAPPGTVGLEVTPNFRMGIWSGGIEIVHESGLVVYRLEYLVNADDGGWGGCVLGHCTEVHIGEDRWFADSAPPGTYSVLYRLAGAVDGMVTVDAIVED